MWRSTVVRLPFQLVLHGQILQVTTLQHQLGEKVYKIGTRMGFLAGKLPENRTAGVMSMNST
jgi:hypothetical protein